LPSSHEPGDRHRPDEAGEAEDDEDRQRRGVLAPDDLGREDAGDDDDGDVEAQRPVEVRRAEGDPEQGQTDRGEEEDQGDVEDDAHAASFASVTSSISSALPMARTRRASTASTSS